MRHRLGAITARLPAAVRKLRGDRRGSVALLMAMTTPSLVMAVGIGVEVTRWTVVKLELQRTADVAALAGAAEYALASNAQNAANAAASVAELNGAAGATTRTWAAGSQTLTDNQVTAQVAAGVRNSQNTGVTVTITQTVPLALTQVMSSLSSVTISASGWAEVAANVQPCILALDPSGGGVTAQGNPNLTATGCSVRSNASISTGGSASMTAAAFYVNGSITGSGISGALHPNDGAIPDPYAHYAPVQNAFAQLKAGAGASFSNKPSDVSMLSPGTYSGWDIKGTVSLLPGIYYVNGDISLGAQASVSGGGVTIITSGALSMNGGAALNVSAATSGSASGAIPGVVFAGNSTSANSFLGNTSPSLTGVVYFPNSDLNFGGTAQGGTTGCLEVIAKSVTLKGNASTASNCSAYGTLVFSSDASSPVALVQ
jgi:Flp pilus assembly protein TadG